MERARGEESVSRRPTKRARFEDGQLTAQYPWMRYGLYALVQTARWKRAGLGALEVDTTAGDGRSIYFDGGYLYSGSDRSSPVCANYLTFSLTPAQIGEEPKTLAQAAEEATKRMAALRIDPDNTSKAMSQLGKLAEELKASVAEFSAKRVGERAAQASIREHEGKLSVADWKAKFESDDYWPAFSAQLLSTGLKQTEIDALKQAMIAKWSQRSDSLAEK